MRHLWAFIIIVIIITVYLVSRWTRASLDEYMYGFWTATDDRFCEDSGIDSMLLFMGEAEHGWLRTTRPCYIIITNNISNQGFDISYRRPITVGVGSTSYSVDATVTFDDEALWPDNVVVTVDMLEGTLRITDRDGTIYALLHKQHDTTNTARAFIGAEYIESDDTSPSD